MLDGPGERIGRGCTAVLEPRDAIAQRGDSQSAHGRTNRGVGDLIDTALPEAAIEPDMMAVWHHTVVHGARKAPARSWNDLSLRVGLITHEEYGPGFFQV